MIEVDVRYRQQNRQTAISGTLGDLHFEWRAQSKAGHGTAIDGTWGPETVAVEMHERRVGTGLAVVSGLVGQLAVTLDISHHLRLGLDASGSIGADDIALRLDRPVGARRRIVHLQPQPDVSLQVAWQNLGGTLTGQVTRPFDALAAAIVGLAARETTSR